MEQETKELRRVGLKVTHPRMRILDSAAGRGPRHPGHPVPRSSQLDRDERVFWPLHRQYLRASQMRCAAINTSTSPETEMMVSHTDHVLSVSTTVRLKYSFTSQKPPSLT